MGSDRARGTYDPKQQYRSVVMQQGRVTLEADWNEAAQITNEEIRKEVLDFVGPCGTPDDGYKVIVPPTLASPPGPPFDFDIQAGIMYVGGIRAQLIHAVSYSNQPDWRDYGPEDPDWVDPSSFFGSPSAFPTNEFVYLYLREQEVSAVEDPDLKDIALGGPDTAQRTRILQRFVRVASQGTDCVSGLAAAQAKWQTEGLWFDPNTMRLYPWSRLQVGFSGPNQNQNPCQPQAQGGYLNPDNQLIRVQISAVDPQTGIPTFVWGFDDASFLYRVSVDPNDSQSLVFQADPVDSNHQPITGQAVEILRTAADLPNGGDVAATSGFVFTLKQNYSPETHSVTIPTGISLPADYTNSNQSPLNQLFLRVWEQEIPYAPGITLTSPAQGPTGIVITLETPNNQPFHVGDYWTFAVRPATPQTTYPERYQNAPQPPDGPRLWACPLGVIGWSEETGTLISDCRNTFENLVELSKRQQGCCTITVAPKDLTGTTTLQSIVKQASRPTMVVTAANAGAPGNNIAITISNLNLNATPPTFDVTVSETDIYLGLTMGGSPGIEAIIGDEEGGPNDGLAHVLVGSLNPNLTPLDNQTVTFTGGSANANATANVMDTSNQNLAFTLQARNSGADGNLTTASISNLNTTSPPTFALTVTWQKTLIGLNMGTLFPQINSSLGYEITAAPPATVAPAFPAEGVTYLTGGAEANSNSPNATNAQASIFGNPVTICLRPGSYSIESPLLLTAEQSNITIEACGGGATISVLQDFGSKEFVQGMVQLSGANNVTFRGLTFAMPQVLLFQQGSFLAGLSANSMQAIGESGLLTLNSTLAMAVAGCQGLTVENCTFTFPALQLDDILFGAAILAGADCADINLKGNLFEGPAAISATGKQTLATTRSFVLAAGYVQADSLQELSLGAGGVVNGGTLIPSTLDNLVVSNNSFENLTFPVFIATGLGVANFESNVVRSCLTGFTVVPLVASVAGASQLSQNDFRAQVLSNPVAQRFLSIAVAYPRPSSFVPRRRIILTSEPAPPVAAPPGRRAPGSILVQTVIKRVPLVAAAPGRPAAAPPPAAAPAAPGRPATAPGAPPSIPIPRAESLRPLALREAQFFTIVGAGQIGITNVGGPRPMNFSVDFSNNDIIAVLPGVGGWWALSILDVADLLSAGGVNPGPNTETTFGMLSLTGNKLRNSATMSDIAFPYTASVMVDYCAATGNVIFNQAGKDGFSLGLAVWFKDSQTGQLVNVARGAVTGNVLAGIALLPPRTATALPDWTTYNDYRP
jgi:hypothetical protein